MKHDHVYDGGLCDGPPEKGDTCERCDKRLWRRVYWLRTSYEYVEGDYICPACFREATFQPNLWERLRNWFKEMPCKMGWHKWFDWGDGLVHCAQCFEQAPPSVEGNTEQ